MYIHCLNLNQGGRPGSFPDVSFINKETDIFDYQDNHPNWYFSFHKTTLDIFLYF